MDLLGVFSNPAYKGLLSEGDNEQLRRQALLNSGLATLAASQGGQPGTGRAALFPALLQGLQAGQQAYTSGAEGLLKSQELQQKRMQEQRRKQLLGGLALGSATQDALAGGGGPTVANAEKMQQAQGASKERYLRAFNEAISMGDVDLAKQLKDAMEVQFPKQDSLFDKIDPSKYTPESIKAFASSQDYGVLQPIKEGAKFSGAYGNLALAMFGTNDASQMSQQQMQALDSEARRRNLERPPSTNISVNMPSESERTAGFLTQRLQMGLNSLSTAAGIDPKSTSPNLGAEAIKRLTGSEVLKNMANPAQRQVIEAAQMEVLDSALTLGTGAAYTREQLDAYRQTYFPQIGDTPAAIADKQKRLGNLLSAARIKSGRATPTDIGLPAGVTVKKVN